MKKLILLLSLCLGGMLSTSAQDYYPIIAAETTYFGKPDSTLFLALKVDSSKIKNGETTYYFPKQLRLVSPNCGRPTGDSWLGDTANISSDGWVTFVNGNHLPFRISYRAALGSSWQAYSNNHWRANAKVTSHRSETFLGVVDSVKTIALDIRKLDDSDTSHPYDGITLKLSKSHGLIQLLNFFIWDYKLEEYGGIPSFPEDREVLNLSVVGMQQAQNGLLNLTAREIYNCQVGDEWINQERATFGAPPSITYIKKTVLAKEQRGDTVIYSIRRLSKGSTGSQIAEDTIFVKKLLSTLLDLPNALVSGGLYERDIVRVEKQYGRRIKKMVPIGLFPDGDRCWPLSESGTTCVGGTYFEGIDDFYGCDPIRYCYRSLVYYKKGNQEWGTPIVLGIEEEKAYDQFFQLFPNPTKGQVQLKNLGYSGNVSVAWYNLQGIKVKEQAAHATESTLDMSDLPAGLYMYELKSSVQVLKKGRMILQ